VSDRCHTGSEKALAVELHASELDLAANRWTIESQHRNGEGRANVLPRWHSENDQHEIQCRHTYRLNVGH
jgi:hypothetical protein